MPILLESAPAKLNLFLGVEPGLQDGKHRLSSVFTVVGLADELCFESNATGCGVELTTTCAPGIAALDVSGTDNLVCRAVLRMETAFGRSVGGLRITLHKAIPAQAGLGGGSSDAAATIRALARLWGIDPLDSGCLDVACALGADVAFFLRGGCALMCGVGERFERRLVLPPLPVVLVKPASGVSTAAAYRAFDADPQPVPQLRPLLDALDGMDSSGGANGAASSLERIAAALANNLTAAACEVLPELRELIAELRHSPGVLQAQLCGSGSTVFGMCRSEADAVKVAKLFVARGYWTAATTTESAPPWTSGYVEAKRLSV